MTKARIELINQAASSEITLDGHRLDADGITKWLVSKSIIEANEELQSYRDLSVWSQAGAETYFTHFQIETDFGIKDLVIKALITMFPERSLRDWFRRRNTLAANGIPVSRWYWFGKGIVIEDFYEFTAIEMVKLETLSRIGFKLDLLGFETMNFIEDIRADKDGNPYFVDFGSDLGEPSTIKTSSARDRLYKTFPNRISEIDGFYSHG